MSARPRLAPEEKKIVYVLSGQKDDVHLLPQLGELEHALLVELDPLLQDSQKHLDHTSRHKSLSDFK